jgi:ATP adenylyltransferase
MKHLWSPWRMSYIMDHKNEGCVFCSAPAFPDGLENLIVSRGKYAYTILNRYPYTSGHLMVVPFEHCAALEKISREVRAEIMESISDCVQMLTIEYQAQGFNVGANLGGAAGAGIPQHLHFHVVPRWQGDTNFMSAVGETRVVPEALDQSYRRICQAWKNLKKST